MAAAVVLCLVCAYFFLLQKNIRKLSVLNAEFNTMESSFVKIKKDESYVPKLEKEIIDNKQKISLIKRRMPTDINVAELVQSLAQIGTKIGMKEYTSLVPEVIMGMDKYLMVPLKVIFNCEYSKLIEYLKELEKMERLVRIDGIKVKTNDQDQEEIIVELSLTAFSLLEKTKK